MIPETIGPKPTVGSLIQHIKHIRDTFGPGLLALGTDYLGIGSTPQGLESIDNISRLINELLNAGFNEGEVSGLLYGNALRVIKANLT